MARSLVVLGCGVGALVAQVPDGHYVLANARLVQFATSAPGGLFVIHPITGAWWPIAGLPAAITGAGLPVGTSGGANSIEYRRSDGALVVGTCAPSGPIELHEVLLAPGGTSVQSVRTTSVGTVGIAAPGGTPGGGIAQTALLPNGDVIVGVRNLGAGPLANQILGVVTPSSGSVTPIQVTPMPAGELNALAVIPFDPVSLTPSVAFAMVDPATLASQIYSVPTRGGAPTLIQDLPSDTVSQMRAHTPQPYGGSNGWGGEPLCFLEMTGTRSLLTLTFRMASIMPRHPAGWFLSSTPLGSVDPNAMSFEPATGRTLFATALSGSLPNSVCVFDPATSTASLFVAEPAGGWGFPTGATLNPDPGVYGSVNGEITWLDAGSPAIQYELGSPGGLPSVGNATFSVRDAGMFFGEPGMWFWSTAPTTGLPGPGGTTLWLSQPISTGGVLPTYGGPIPLPIPNQPALRGLEVFLQTFHLVGYGTLENSEGLHLTIL